jgi:cell division protein FtsW (lipid II flippase)
MQPTQSPSPRSTTRNQELLLLVIAGAINSTFILLLLPNRIDLKTFAIHLTAFLLLHFTLRFRRGPASPTILPTLYALTAAGLLIHSFFHEPGRSTLQHTPYLTGVLAGCAVFGIIALLPSLHSLADFKYIAIATAISLAGLLVAFGSGPRGTDAKINLLGVQPAEAIKLLFVLFLAAYFADRDIELRRLHGLDWGWLRLPRMRDASPVLITCGCVLALFFLQRDLGPALILYLLFLGIFASVSGRWMLGTLGLAVLIGAFTASYRIAFLGTVKTRIEMWLHPWDNHHANGIQLAESLWSLSSGGWHGLWSNASVAYLPAGHTDLILASATEVFGFGGFLLLMGLELTLFLTALRAAFRASAAFEGWFAYGLALLLGIQTVFMASATLGLLPLSGLPVPFLSYGKSATIAGFALAAMVWNISNSANPRATRRILPPGARVMPGIIATCALTCLLRAGQVSLVQADMFIAKGALTPQADGVRRYVYNRRLLDLAAKIRRGDILDRNGIAIATNDPAHARSAAAALVGNGVEIELPPAGFSRYYTLGPAAVHILGHTGAYWTDPRTIEKLADTKLRGYRSPVRITTVDGHRAASYDYAELVPLYREWERGGSSFERILGRDRSFHSTIDAKMQLAAARALESSLPVIGGKRRTEAAAVVLDAATGQILASVSLPSYDPNHSSPDNLVGIYDAPE